MQIVQLYKKIIIIYKKKNEGDNKYNRQKIVTFKKKRGEGHRPIAILDILIKLLILKFLFISLRNKKVNKVQYRKITPMKLKFQGVFNTIKKIKPELDVI